MATRKEARKKSLLQLLALIIAVAVIVVSVVLFQNWWNSRPGPEPKDVKIKASVGDQSLEVAPYMVCEIGTDCPEGEPPNLTVGENDTLHLEIPEEVSANEWRILSIYDDPAANDETIHGANETSTVDVPGSVDPIAASKGKRPRLMVVEISALMLGTDAKGEEAPFSTVWSLSTMSDEDLAEATKTAAPASEAAAPTSKPTAANK